MKELVDFQAMSYRSGAAAYDRDFDSLYGVIAFDNLESAISEVPTFAIIANPTSLHAETALALAKAGIPFLLEKPVSDREKGLDLLLETVQQKKLPVLVGFQLRYHPGFQRIVKWLNSGAIGQPIGFQARVGQWLPEWRSGKDYRNSYSAQKQMGGGVILDLCHELDLAVTLMGRVRRVSCICGHYSSLEIETEDMAEISLEHEEGRLSQVHMDYVERVYNRACRLIGTDGSIVWNYGEGFAELIRANGQKDYWTEPEEFDREWLFRAQLKHWLQVLSGEVSPKVSLKDGIYVTRVALASKRSSEENRHIFL